MHEQDVKKMLELIEALYQNRDVPLDELQHDFFNLESGVEWKYTDIYRLISRLFMGAEVYAEKLIEWNDYDGALLEYNAALYTAVECMLRHSYSDFYKKKSLLETAKIPKEDDGSPEGVKSRRFSIRNLIRDYQPKEKNVGAKDAAQERK